MFDLHTVAVADGASPPAILDQLSLVLGKGLPFSAAAGCISAIDTISNAGTGYTQLPVMTFTGGTGAGGIAVVTSLKAVSLTIAAGGSSYGQSDVITLSNGVGITVLTVTSGAVATASITTAGTLVGPSMVSNPVAQASVVSPTGGLGATFNLLYGVNAVQLVDSGSYSVVPTGASFLSANGNGSNAAVQSLHLGGNGLPIYKGLTGLQVATPLNVFGQTSVPAIVSTPLKRNDVIVCRLDPITAAVSIAAGTLDLTAIG